MDRRTFVQRTCITSAGLLVGGIPVLGDDEVVLPPAPPIDVHEAPLAKKSPLGMPGLYPGRVVELHDARSIVGNRVSQPVIRGMLEQGLRELTGEKTAPAAWAKFVEPHDVVGVKINPSGAPACCSSPELVREIIRGVQSAGVPTQNIVVYDRFGDEMDLGSYQLLMPPGVLAQGAVFVHQSFDWRAVLGGTVALEGGAERHGRDQNGVARRAADTEPGLHLPGRIDAGEYRSCGDGHGGTGDS